MSKWDQFIGRDTLLLFRSVDTPLGLTDARPVGSNSREPTRSQTRIDFRANAKEKRLVIWHNHFLPASKRHANSRLNALHVRFNFYQTTQAATSPLSGSPFSLAPELSPIQWPPPALEPAFPVVSLRANLVTASKSFSPPLWAPQPPSLVQQFSPI